jgi:protein-S-isoprenylcysteine O-methyltransferase Ste14
MLVPPPVWLAAAFLAGYAIDRRLRRLPLVSQEHEGTTETVGLVLGVVALLIIGAAFVHFFRARATLLPVGKTARLVTGGVFRFTRNPMYLSLTLLYLGLTLMANSIWPLVFLPIALAVIVGLFIPYEERRMRRLFGDEYDAYRARVRRWL